VVTLARLARVLERASTDPAAANLTLAQYRLLAMIADGADRASEVAGRLALAKPTVSATIDTLVERGLLTRESSAADRRAVRLQLTPFGRDTLAAADRSMRAVLDDLLGRVADPDALRRSLRELHAALDERRAERRAERAPR